MMKKFLTVLVLGLVVFVASCSSSNEDLFLNEVKGQTYIVSGDGTYTFSSDGKIATCDGWSVTYVNATSSSTAIYTDSSGLTYTITISGSIMQIA